MGPTIFKGKRGKLMIFDGKFEYHLNSKNANGTKMYWLCTKREVCKAILITNADIDNGVTVCSSTPRVHS